MKTVGIKDLYEIKDLHENNCTSNDEALSENAAFERYRLLYEGFIEKFGEAGSEAEEICTDRTRICAPSHPEISYFSAPGRCEIIGNHTDHNGGRVIAASIDMDTITAAAPNGTDVIRVFSREYGLIEVDLGKLRDESGDKAFKENGSAALIAGICEAAVKSGYCVSGFDAYMTTEVIPAAGVSSSASFEMCICAIINFLFNDNRMSENECAHFGQYAENVYWNKSSGLMDQIACAVGGAVYMDFSDKGEVAYKSADISFENMGYKLILVNTGKGHADLSEEYSAVPNEMFYAAGKLGCERLCETTLDELIKNASKIDNDRALLRAIHFYNENERVDAMYEAMKRGDTAKIMSLIAESGRSSFELLQNCYCSENTGEQKIPLALALTENFLKSHNKSGKSGEYSGVCRVHGGGFAGVIMSVIPSDIVFDYIDYMAGFFGKENIHIVDVRKYGAVRVKQE